MGTPDADRERQEMLATYAEASTSSFFYHYARLIEILYASERMEQLLNEEDILSPRVRARADRTSLKESALQKRHVGR